MIQMTLDINKNVPFSEKDSRNFCINELISWGFFEDELQKMDTSTLAKLHYKEAMKHKYGPKD